MTHSKHFFLIITLFFLTIPLITYGQEKQSNEPAVEEAKSKKITVYKRPNCRCCSKWVSYLEENGFSVDAQPSDTLVDDSG